MQQTRQPARQPEKPSAGFRIKGGDPTQIRVVSFCDEHGFGPASYQETLPSGSYLFRGDCGCEMRIARFLMQTAPGVVKEVKIK